MRLLQYGLILCMAMIVLESKGQKVTTDFDKTVDFTKYSTYKFLGWQDDSGELINDLDQRRMRDAFRNELTSRGLTLDENSSDLAISLFFVMEKKTSTTAYTDYYGGGYGMYRRGGWGWGGGYATTNYTENDYVQGTLVMDVYDEGTQELIWQAVASGAITDNPKKKEKNIPYTIKKLMKKYPVKPSK